MLIPVQTGGRKLPILLVHGMFGILPWRRGRALADYLGPDQPLFGIEAPGFDGSRKPRATVPDAANEYLREVRRAGLRAPFVVVGICGGGIMALQLAQQLRVAAEFAHEPPPVPLLAMIDPPGLPGQEFDTEQLTPEVAALLHERISEWLVGTRERLEDVPFDLNDPRQLAIATDVGAAVEWSLGHYYPTPYAGRVEILATEQIAQLVDRAHWPWRSVLVGPWNLSTLNCRHQDFFSTHIENVFEWLKQLLDGLSNPSLDPAPQEQPAT
jgi:thioesterase domain-containing protein